MTNTYHIFLGNIVIPVCLLQLEEVVFEGISGDYKSVAHDIKKHDFVNPLENFSFDAEERFKDMRKLYKS